MAPDVRGGSVVFDFPGAADVCRELNRRKFFCDHRPSAGIPDRAALLHQTE